MPHPTKRKPKASSRSRGPKKPTKKQRNLASAKKYKETHRGRQETRANKQKRDMGQTVTGKYYRGEVSKMSKKKLIEELLKMPAMKSR